MTTKDLPAGTVEALDFIHDPKAIQRAQIMRKTGQTEANLRAMRPELWNGAHACNLILLPDLASALSLYRAHVTKCCLSSDHNGHFCPDLMEQRIDGRLCHLTPEQIAACEALSRRLADAVRELRPSLNAAPRMHRAEMGDLWDAGLIAQGDERPCFDPHFDGAEPAKGAGDGAFRILCNTDTAWGQNDGQNLATTLCLASVLSTFGPVEIWVQQGWLAHHNTDPTSRNSGITCFRVGSMGSISPAALAFWLGSPFRDSPFSWLVNQEIGRGCGGTSGAPAIPCDFYNGNATGWPGSSIPDAAIALTQPETEAGQRQLKRLAEHLAGMLCAVVYPDSVTAHV